MGDEYLNGYAKFDDLDMIIQNPKLIRMKGLLQRTSKTKFDDYYYYFIWIFI